MTVHNGNVTWYRARDLCRQTGYDLAQFDGQDMTKVMAELKSLKLDGHYWIGLTKVIWKSG